MGIVDLGSSLMQPFLTILHSKSEPSVTCILLSCFKFWTGDLQIPGQMTLQCATMSSFVATKKIKKVIICKNIFRSGLGLVCRKIRQGRLTPTFIPSSQLCHRSPLVRKQATACLARWWIQPSSLSWVMMASIQGKPVFPLDHFAKASLFLSQGTWKYNCWYGKDLWVLNSTFSQLRQSNKLNNTDLFPSIHGAYKVHTTHIKGTHKINWLIKDILFVANKVVVLYLPV